MGEMTLIQWCHHTFNGWIGCTKVSAGCANCYAESLMDKRWGKVQWGKGNERQRTSPANWKQPLKWNRDAAKAGERRRVFCSSLADVLDDEVPQSWRRDLAELIDETQNLDWLLLTKRPENIGLWPAAFSEWTNVWWGTSVENQEMHDLRVPRLQKIRAVVRFISYEPALEGVRFDLAGIHWVIVGGESGKKARPFRLGWARDTIRQCMESGVACFVKQLGSNPEYEENVVPFLKDSKGGDWNEWPEDLRVREFPIGAP